MGGKRYIFFLSLTPGFFSCGFTYTLNKMVVWFVCDKSTIIIIILNFQELVNSETTFHFEGIY